jgi:phosphatidylinositol phospholipase C delta
MSTRDAKRATMDFQLLSRARNLFTLADHTELGNSGEDDNRSPQSNNGFGSSIKKKLKEVKAASLQRSRSISSRFAPNSERKSLECPPQGSSGLGDTPPQVVHPSNAPGSLPIAAGASGSGDGALTSTPEPLIPVSHRPQPQQPIEQQPAMDITVPALLQTGTPMTKVTANKQKKVVLRLDADQGEIVWESKKHRISPCSLSLLLIVNRLIIDHSTYRAD